MPVKQDSENNKLNSRLCELGIYAAEQQQYRLCARLIETGLSLFERQKEENQRDMVGLSFVFP